ncbi:MAG: hypothetical protein HYW01_01755 [Deltaproteobacteria bacterium]|nr:hypothetical protein [Deltaproteobacteria bacterium]
MALFVLAAQTVEVWANGTETLGPPTGITIQKGSGIVSGGTGLVVQPGTINVNVPFGATVKQVLLYWDCKGAGGDNSINIDGMPVTGTQIGGGGAQGTSFRADITSKSLIDEGPNSLVVDGMNCPTANNGGVLVIFDQRVTAEFSGKATVLDAFVNVLGLGLIDVQQV